MPTTMDSSYTAASSEETVPHKDMAYNRKNIHMLLIPMRENNFGPNRGLEEITEVQEM